MISKNPFFSIIIPTYNAEKVIERCLKSIISQTCESYEVIIVDGCSNDNTINIAERFSITGDKIKLFSQKDESTYDAMNKGINWLQANGCIF
jgi:glycosyltransferase involved in cell wall biosynthesis